jgi:hypothetical protein
MAEDDEVRLQNRLAAEIETLERKLAIWATHGFFPKPQFRVTAERKQVLQRELELSRKRQALKTSAEQSQPNATKAEQSKPAERGKYCCEVIEDAKKIKNLCLATGRSVVEIQGENPDLAIWKVRESLGEDDRDVFNHPNRWGAPVGYAKNILAKTSDVSVHTITSWVKIYRKTQRSKKHTGRR